MSDYLLKSPTKNFFLNALLAQNQCDYLVGSRLLTLEELLYTDVEMPTIYDFYDALLKIQDSPLHKMFNDYGFIAELYQGKKELDIYDVAIDELELDKELKDIYAALPLFPYRQILAKIQNNDYSKLKIIDEAYDYNDNFFIQQLIAQKATLIQDERPANHQNYQCLFQNKGLCIEGMLQYIINNNIALKDVAIIVLDGESKLLKSLLKAYGLSYYSIINDEVNPLALKFMTLLDFYQKSDRVNLEALLNVCILPFASKDLANYLKKYSADTFNIHEAISLRSSNEKLNESFIAAEKEREEALAFLNPLMQAKNFKEAIIIAYNMINDKSLNARRLKVFIEKNLKYLDLKYYFIFREELKKLPIAKQENDGILIESLFDGIVRPYLFILNANQNLFPGFKGRSGLINEEVLKASNYPALDLRYRHHLESLAYLEKSKISFYLCPKGNYEGKSVEVSSFIENYPLKDLSPLVLDAPKESKHELSQDAAKKAFLKDNVWLTSVSAVEQYHACPYAYFLNYGLKLRDTEIMAFDAASFGQILHDIMAQALNKYHKQYPSIDDITIEEIIAPYFKELANLYPQKSAQLKISHNKLLSSLKVELAFLQALEAQTSFIPQKAEAAFEDFFIDEEDLKIKIKGFIDRIDYNDAYFRIIDYKTSSHTLNKNDLESGNKLQLATYLVMLAQKDDKKALGAYYLNLNHPSLKFNDFKYGLTRGLEYEDQDEDKLFLAEHRLNGISVEDINEFGENFLYLANGNNKKHISKNSLCDIDELKRLLKTIYSELYKELSSGNIAIDPKKGACTYCKYRKICHFKGGNFRKDKIYYQFAQQEGEKDELQ